MKHLKLVVALVLISMVATSLGFAGRTKAATGKVTPLMSQSRVSRSLSPLLQTDSDIPAGRALKSGRTNFRSLLSKNPTLAKPIPEVNKTSAVTSGLSGLYHIPGDFPDMASAVAVLNFIGLSGNTTFELDAASYNLNPVTFGSWPGNSTYTLTISPGPSLAVTINFESDSLHGKGFAFVGASNVTIDGLNTGGSSLALKYDPVAPFPLGDPFGSTIYITDACDHIAVKNANVQGNVNDPVWVNQTEGRSAIFIYTADADPNFSTNITFDGLTITRATYGIKVLPQSPAVTVDGLTINNCKIGGAYGDPVAIGGFYEYPVDVTFTNNVIDGSEFLDWYFNNTYTEYDVDVAFGVGPIFYNLGQETGSHFISVDAGVFHDNIIRNVSVNGSPGEGILSYGSRISQGNDGLNIPAVVYNNRIYGISNPGGGTAQITGLRGTAGHVYHNSIQLTGVVVGGSVVSRCLNGVTDAYNNALSNEMTGPTSANITAIVSGGTIDYNAANSTNGRAVSGFATGAAAAAAGVNANGTFGPINFTADLHLDAAGPSAAENMGKPEVLAANDIDGQPRDTTFAGTRDAGADEVSAALTNPWVNDVSPGKITSPVTGAPVGLFQTPVVVVKNNTNTAAGPFNLELTVSDGYDQIIPVSLNAQQTKSITFPTWTPASAIAYTFTATTSLAGDVVPGNNTVVSVVTAAAPVAIPAGPNTSYNWDASLQGWSTTNDFVRSNSFTKLGGPLSGFSMVTICPLFPDMYTEGALASTEGYAATYPGPNLLISPWFDLTALTTDVYISFQHSIAVEPGWDGSWVDYTTDGVNWHHLGQPNDATPGNVNWYNSSVYQNAVAFTGNPPDTATMVFPNYNLYGPGSDNPALGFGWWSSNGYPGLPSQPAETGQPLGPFGYVFAQFHITAAHFPDIVGKPLVKFRYVAFSDAVNPPGTSAAADAASAATLGLHGWAVDNFQIGGNGATFVGNTINGTVYQDQNGNGTDDAEPPVVDGTKVYLSYFGVLKDSATTVSGAFSFNTVADNSGLPGTYNLTTNITGVAFSEPHNASQANVTADGSGSTLSQNIGVYTGSVSGTAYSDVNDNSVNNSEPGLPGWTVEVDQDSVGGAVFLTKTTGVGGAYTFLLAPGNYGVKEYAKPSTRITEGASGYNFTVTGTSGSGTAVITGEDYGDYLFSSIRVEASIDYNGDGVKNLTDHTPLAGGVKQLFEFRREGVLLDVDTLGNTTLSINHFVDSGFYSVKRVSATPAGYLKTSAADSFGFTLTNGSVLDTANTLYFDDVIASGQKFNDANGNGIQDTLEAGIPNWPINITGTGGGTVLTDSNGNWSINTLGPGSHTISEGAAPYGSWTNTLNAGITFTAFSGGAEYVSNNKTGLAFGNFKNVTIYGVKYNDRNDNGSKGTGEEGLAGWRMRLSTTGGTILDSALTNANGNYTFSNIGPSPDTLILSEAGQSGWVNTQPGGSGKYTIILHSGDSVSYSFGNFFGSDSSLFRTWTAAQWFGAANTPATAKFVKAFTYKKPTVANLSNVVNNIYLVIGGPASLQVGLSGQLNPKSKEKAYLLGAKYSDIWATFNTKGTTHTGAARGLDFTTSATVMLKKYKSIPESKKNDVLVADALALKLNIEVSNTSMLKLQGTGLGNLIYKEAGNALGSSGTMTISAISASLDSIMTNWEGVPYSTYLMYDSVVAKINAAFSDGSAAVPYDTASWIHLGTIVMNGYHSFASVPFLIGNPGAKPTQVLGGSHTPMLPTVFALAQNYPNPFNPTSTVQFDVPGASIVTIKVYNILGQEITTLLDHQNYDGATRDVVTFDGSNLASGIYFYRMTAQLIGDNGQQTGSVFTQVRKMMLVK